MSHVLPTIKQTVHAILIRNAQLKHRFAWQRRGEKTAKREENPDLAIPTALDHHEGRDPELLHVLALATDDELDHIVKTLHAGSMFSPVIKSLVMHGSKNNHSYDLEHAPREDVERYIEARFRFLAADAPCIIQENGVQYPSYRQALLLLRKRLRVDCRSSLDTPDLEMEVFLHLLSESSGSHDGYDRSADGREGSEHGAQRNHHGSSLQRTSRGLLRGIQTIQAEDMLPTLAKSLATVAATKAQVGVIRNLGNMVMQRAAYHRALAFVHAGSTELGKRLMVEKAKQRLVGAVVEYTTMRSIFTFVGPLLWASTACDLVWMSLGTDYARLAKTVALLAQIRLLHTSGWVGPDEKPEKVSRENESRPPDRE